jgi:hypothetical protein
MVTLCSRRKDMDYRPEPPLFKAGRCFFGEGLFYRAADVLPRKAAHEPPGSDRPQSDIGSTTEEFKHSCKHQSSGGDRQNIHRPHVQGVLPPGSNRYIPQRLRAESDH